MSLIVDASVAVKWFAEEPGSPDAERLLERDDLFAPTIIVAEVANAFWKRVRRGASSVDQAMAALDRLPHAFSALHAIEPLAAEAIRLAVDQDHPVYDCLYLALARSEGAPLATADRKLAALAERADVGLDRIA
jgi:predicted nucleic acid-binding protein